MNGTFRVGPWLVQPAINALSQNGTTIRLEPKQMEVLVCLAQHSSEPVSKDELLRVVWQDRFVSDDVLTRSIFELRRVFEDDAREPRFIETIPRRGYRLIAAVSHAGESVTVSSVAAPVRLELRKRSWKSVGFIVTAMVAVGGLFVGFRISDLSAHIFGSNPTIHSLAVLPLKDLSSDQSQKYLTYGMAEELITDLSQLSGVKVIPHRSVNRYQEADESVAQIARELQVDALVEGSVQRSGDQVRVTAQLIYAPQNFNLWAKTYDGNLRDVLALQSRLASEIADEIRVKVTPQEAARLAKFQAVDPRALESYWKGQYSLSRLKHEEMVRGREQNARQELQDAIANFEHAFQIDPNYAPAYLGYSEAISEFKSWFEPRTELMQKEKWSLIKAVQLDDTLAAAHLALASTYFATEWDWIEAEKQFRRAIELGPNSAEAHSQYGFFLDSMGRSAEGLKQHQMQLRLDPDLVIPTSCSPWMPLELRIEQEERFIDTHNNASIEHYWMLYLLLDKARLYRQAIDIAAKGWQSIGWNAVAHVMQRGYQKRGYREALRETASYLEARAKDKEPVAPNVLAHIYGVLGDQDRAFLWLQRAVDVHDGSIAPMKTCLDYEPLRSDPRFAKILRGVGLPQ